MIQTNKELAITRITALWALSESGMGGVLHALRVPFTGIFAGGFALIMLCLLAHFSDRNPAKMLSALLVVLLIKAGVSPHSPFPAYFAVSFQAFVSILIYRFLGIHFFSVFLACLIALLESAFQKLIFLTLFFGENIWVATDKMMAHAGKQVGMTVENGSLLAMGIYTGIYFFAAIPVSVLTIRLFRKISSGESAPPLPEFDPQPASFLASGTRKSNRQVFIWLFILTALSLALYVFRSDQKSFIMDLTKTLVWSFSALLIWFVLLNPFLVFLIKRFLSSKRQGLQSQINEALGIFPAFSRINALAWQHSAGKRGFFRLPEYLFLLLVWCLTYPSENQS